MKGEDLMEIFNVGMVFILMLILIDVLMIIKDIRGMAKKEV